jgi:type I restriction enzyme S subunit
LDELIAAETEKLDALKRHKKGLLQQLFPAEGETTPRLRFPQFRNAGEWKTTNLKSVAFISSGTTPSRTNAAFFANGTIPWVKTMDLNNAEIRHTDEMVVEDSGVKINPPGSVLVAMYGGFNQIGRTGLLTKPSATNQAIAVLKPQPGAVSSRYLLVWLNANVEQWKRVAASSRKDANITSSDVANFDISVPMLEAEETEITVALEAIETVLAGVAQWLANLHTHKAALMQQLFPSMDEI